MCHHSPISRRWSRTFYCVKHLRRLVIVICMAIILINVIRNCLGHYISCSSRSNYRRSILTSQFKPLMNYMSIRNYQNICFTLSSYTVILCEKSMKYIHMPVFVSFFLLWMVFHKSPVLYSYIFHRRSLDCFQLIMFISYLTHVGASVTSLRRAVVA